MSSFSEIHCRENLFPFTLTRHTADLRVGMFTNRERWTLASTNFSSLDQLQDIPANLIPGYDFFMHASAHGLESAVGDTNTYRTIHYPWDIAIHNAWVIEQDYRMLVRNRKTAMLPEKVNITGPLDQLFIEPGAIIGHCYINTTHGPVYIGKQVEIMDGVMMRGPVSIGEGTVIKMGAAIYGGVSIGPFCNVGGELKNSVLFEYANKAHHGYLGDAVIGAWCNMGAGSSCSNIRNTATPVKVWHMHQNAFLPAGLKCGLMMADYSRCGINTSFNTGTVVGVSVNIFQSGPLLPKYIPSFSWGTDNGIRYDFEKAIADINNWMAFKKLSLTQSDIEQLKFIYSNTEQL
jgi:UDP-N-acetylglucosamine diphosphorylase/glucosamine-1-phosphate N-acetyltransferase